MALGGGGISLPTISQRIVVDDSQMGGVSKRFGSVGKTMGAAVAGGAAVAAAGIGAFVAKGVSGAKDVETGLREVVTLTGATGDAAREMTDQFGEGVAGLSNELGLTQEAITSGLYDAISAGVPADNVFDFMRTAGKASVAGVTDIGTAVDGLTSTVNAFGLNADQAGEVADSMFAAVQGGKTTFEELSASMFNVAPAAAGLNIPFQDVNAALATLTASGTPTAQATTQMRAALSELGKDGTKAATAFEGISGKTFPDFIDSGGTLQEALAMMGEEAGGNATALSNMFGSVEAGAAAAQLGVTNLEKFSAEIDRQGQAAGGAADAFDTMEDTTNRAFERLKVQVSNAGMAIGAELLPHLANAADWLGQHLPGAIATVKTAFATVMTVIRTVIGVLSSMGLTMDNIKIAFETAKTVVTTVIETIRSVFSSATGDIGSSGSRISTIIGQVKAVFTSGMEAIRTAVRVVTNFVMSVWRRFGADLLKYLKTSLRNVMDALSGVLDVITGIFEVFIGVFTGDWSRAWEGIKKIVAGVWRTIRAVISQAINVVKTTVRLGLAVLASIMERVWGGIKDAAAGLWRAVTGYFGRMVDSAKDRVSGLVSFVRGIPGRILSAVGNLSNLLRNAGRNIIQGLISGITSKVGAIRDKMSSVASTVRRFLPFSPAKEGPLSGSGSPDRAGRKIGSMIATGLERSQSDVAAAAGAVAGAARVGLPMGPGSARGAYAATGGHAGVSQTNHFDVKAFDVGEAARELGARQVEAMRLLPVGG